MLYLLSLILLCPIHNEITRRILDNLMNNLLSVIKVISIDMYSYWLEVPLLVFKLRTPYTP